jgi:membrane fusion protein (multidrug efflux system)
MEHGIRRFVVPRTRILRALVLVWAASSVGLLSGCPGADAQGRGRGQGGGHGPGGGGDDTKTAMKVVVTQVRPERLERWYRASGTLTAVRSAELVAVEPGIIEKLDVDEGDVVKAGDVLARLDGRELALQASTAKLQLDNLERELQRLESAKGGVISAEEIDKQRYAVAEARAAAKLSKVQAKQTVVRAPFSGTIVERHVDIGNLATTATPLFSLADLSALELELHIPERDAASVQKDTLVEIELVDGTTFTAKVFRKAPIVDAVTGTVKFTVRAEERPASAVPGAFARARVLVAARDEVASLEREAVFEIEGVPHVYVVADGKARRREVKTGLEGSGRIEIVSGIEASDVIVAEGKGGVTEGMPLSPVEPEDAEAAGAGSTPPSPAAGS